MTKKELQKLARTDGLTIRFSGKTKKAYMYFEAAINVDYIQKYKKV